MAMTVPQTPTWQSLAAVAEAVRACQMCRLCGGRTNAVPGEGAPSASIMFIGEGPGANEDMQGRPFVGRAGRVLDQMLANVPLAREDVFITNVVKCRPPENRDPEPDEVASCWPYLEAQIALIRPRVIATLGRHSLYRFFPEAKISRDHGHALRWRDIVIFPLYHPAAALRTTAVMEALAADFRKLPDAILESLRLQPPGKRVTPNPTMARAYVGGGPSPAAGGTATPPVPSDAPVATRDEDAKRQMTMF